MSIVEIVRKKISNIFQWVADLFEPEDKNFNTILNHWKDQRLTLSFDKRHKKWQEELK